MTAVLVDRWGKPLQRDARSDQSSGAEVARLRAKLRARYDAADTNPENRNHWAGADDLSARAANSLSVRKTLRQRARYEVANNCYAAGMLLTMSNDIVGSGPRLQFQTPDAGANSLIEREFAAWCRDVRFAQKLRTMCITKPRDGECFARMTSNPNHESPVWLDFELVETDQVTTPSLIPADDHIDGIWFDAYRQPEFYDILDRHPGDRDTPTISPIPKKIDAKSVIHWFLENRPGQKRGVSEITPALPLFGQLRRYTLAVIDAAETAADFAAIVSSTADANDGGDTAKPFEEIEITRRMLLTLPNQMQLQQLKAEQPVTTYGMFKQEILNEIARCINMSYNIAAGNSSNYNFSSGRLDHQLYFRSIAIIQSDCEAAVLDRLFREWYREAVLLNLVPRMELRYRPWSWSWDPATDLDPEKSARARTEDLRSGALTLDRMYAELGLDREVEQQRQADGLGISVPELQQLLIQYLYGASAETAPLGNAASQHLIRAIRAELAV